MDVRTLSKTELLLRFGISGMFLGHGVVALLVEERWIPYFSVVGLGREVAVTLLPLIGMMDILISFIILYKPTKPLLIWCTILTVITTLIRPLSGESIWEAIQRTGNWILPLALLYLHQEKSAQKAF